ncbi:MAG: Gldg family protein, partial [Treponema sp.]|nr:Gldg family protein [Treponema sp.]
MKQLYKKYLYKYAINPFTYLICALFILYSIIQFFVFHHFFGETGTTDLHQFFSAIPYICIFVIPTLGSFVAFSEDELYLPSSSLAMVSAKILSLLTVVGISLVLMLVVPVTVSFYGDVDVSSLFTSYFVLILYFLCSTSLAVFIFTAVSITGFAFVICALVLAAVNSLHLVALYINPNSFVVSVAKFFSFAWHFDAAGKGLLDSRDVIFFLAAFFLFAYIAIYSLEKKRDNNSAFVRILNALFFAMIVLVCLNSYRFYTRIDTTSDHSYSVGNFSRVLLDEINEPLDITLYQSSSLRNLYPQVQDAEDYLSEYAGRSSFVSYRRLDPDKEDLVSTLESYGVQGQPIQESGKNSYSLVYSAIVISYLGQVEVIPFVLSADTLEYDLDSRIQRLVRNKTRIVQIVIGNGLSLEQDYSYVTPYLESQGFSLVQTYMPSLSYPEAGQMPFSLYQNIPLIVLGTAHFMPEDADALVKFIQNGGKAFIATSPYTVDIKNDWSVVPLEDYVVYRLQELGVYYRDTLTADISNFRITLYGDTDADGNPVTAKTEYINYSLWPVLLTQKNAPTGLTVFWPSAIDIDKEVSADFDFIPEPYLVTSSSAWQMEKIDGQFITDPFICEK